MPVFTQAPTLEAPVEKTTLPDVWLWPPVAVLGLLLAFGSSSLLDPRPAALRRLRQVFEKAAPELPGRACRDTIEGIADVHE